MAYCLVLPPNLLGVQDDFHISQLRKCISDPDVVTNTNQLEVQPNLTYAERLVKIIDLMDRVLRRKMIRFAKVQWSGHFHRKVT